MGKEFTFRSTATAYWSITIAVFFLGLMIVGASTYMQKAGILESTSLAGKNVETGQASLSSKIRLSLCPYEMTCTVQQHSGQTFLTCKPLSLEDLELEPSQCFGIQ